MKIDEKVKQKLKSSPRTYLITGERYEVQDNYILSINWTISSFSFRIAI